MLSNTKLRNKNSDEKFFFCESESTYSLSFSALFTQKEEISPDSRG